MKGQYLALADYSSKYRVSISTLRRRIKTDDIQFKFEDGKYYILDEPASTQPKHNRPSLSSSEVTLVSAPKDSVISERAPSLRRTEQNRQEKARIASTSVPAKNRSNEYFTNHQLDEADRAKQDLNNENLLNSANKLLSELKKAYTQILQEREEQIMNLKDEVYDLKTLVKVLESENDRLKSRLRPEPDLSL